MSEDLKKHIKNIAGELIKQRDALRAGNDLLKLPDTIYCLMTPLAQPRGYDRFRMETIETLPHGVGKLDVVGEDEEHCVQLMRGQLAFAIFTSGIEATTDKAADHCMTKTIQVSRIVS